MSTVLSNERIPNNVHLSDDRRLQRALEKWQPKYIEWWKEMGPEGFNEEHEVYLRTAISVDSKGWAHFDYVKMPEYRWGIFLTDPEPDRKIGFGDFYGEPAWQEVPGEFRNPLRRLLVTQADTEPASVEQQRMLGKSCPSLYDLRSLFQVNVEEGRHLWAMVYLLHTYFGRDGREEAEDLLERRSGNEDKPRILGAFNEPIDNWVDFFCFTFFTDRDGKYQLLALAESAFDPLSRTCKFMLTEEAYHMSVGETGIGRIIRRSAQLMKEGDGSPEDVRARGGVDLPTIQRYINHWFSVSVDLFGSEVSSNAANYFAAGLKGRAKEDKFTDHVATEGSYEMDLWGDGAFTSEEVPLRNAMNEVLRDAYIEDCERGVARWNKILAKEGVDFQLSLPHRRFHRAIGSFAEGFFNPDGEPLNESQWNDQRNNFLPSRSDLEFIRNLQTEPIYEPGKMAHWIAPPTVAIDGKPMEFEYVRKDG